MMELELNKAKKDYATPSHTTEHILNQTMIRVFGCGRAITAHIERKKSKCDYVLPYEPTTEQISEVERRVNEVIGSNLYVTAELIDKSVAKEKYDLSKLPEDASSTLRIVCVGDYDHCPCIGAHVDNTAEIGVFKITTSSYADGIWRVRWKLAENNG